MNEETYEALKRIVALADWARIGVKDPLIESDIAKVREWIDEVAKEYANDCLHLSSHKTELNGSTYLVCNRCGILIREI